MSAFLPDGPVSSYARTCLAVAHAPCKSGLFIAPGISTMTNASHQEIYTSEFPDSERMRRWEALKLEALSGGAAKPWLLWDKSRAG